MNEYYCIECEQLVEPEREDCALCAKCEQAESDEMNKDDYQAGWEHSQARIIKLLEDEMKRIEGWTDYPAVNALMNIRAALIKGENK